MPLGSKKLLLPRTLSGFSIKMFARDKRSALFVHIFKGCKLYTLFLRSFAAHRQTHTYTFSVYTLKVSFKYIFVWYVHTHHLLLLYIIMLHQRPFFSKALRVYRGAVSASFGLSLSISLPLGKVVTTLSMSSI